MSLFGDNTPEQDLYDHLKYTTKKEYNLTWIQVIKIIFTVVNTLFDFGMIEGGD